MGSNFIRYMLHTYPHYEIYIMISLIMQAKEITSNMNTIHDIISFWEISETTGLFYDSLAGIDVVIRLCCTN